MIKKYNSLYYFYTKNNIWKKNFDTKTFDNTKWVEICKFNIFSILTMKNAGLVFSEPTVSS